MDLGSDPYSAGTNATSNHLYFSQTISSPHALLISSSTDSAGDPAIPAIVENNDVTSLVAQNAFAIQAFDSNLTTPVTYTIEGNTVNSAFAYPLALTSCRPSTSNAPSFSATKNQFVSGGALAVGQFGLKCVGSVREIR